LPSMVAVLAFLAKAGPDCQDGAKHTGYAHAAVTAGLFHVAVFCTGMVADGALEAMLMRGPEPPLPAAPAASIALISYWCLLFGGRLCAESTVAGRSSVVYELAWSCTAMLLLAAAAIHLRKTVLLCATGVLVAIDQVLWYVDILGYLVLDKLPIKVCGYLFWPTTGLMKKATAWHHVLFVPLVVFVCARSDGLPLGRGVLVSAAMTVASQVVCRYCTPLELPPGPGEDKPRYLNLNLCHEAFKGLKVEWIKRYDRARPAVYLPWMLWIWNAGNIGLFALLAGLLLLVARLLGFPGARMIM